MFKPSMKKDNIASATTSSLTGEPSFRADFARRVLLTARQKVRRRRLANHIAAAVAVLLVASAIPLAELMRGSRATLTSRDTANTAKREWQQGWNDEALAYQLAQSADPRSAGDYLLPNAAALIGFTFMYSEASRQYDLRWTYNR